jgi:hypothetical protein
MPLNLSRSAGIAQNLQQVDLPARISAGPAAFAGIIRGFSEDDSGRPFVVLVNHICQTNTGWDGPPPGEALRADLERMRAAG